MYFKIYLVQEDRLVKSKGRWGTFSLKKRVSDRFDVRFGSGHRRRELRLIVLCFISCIVPSTKFDYFPSFKSRLPFWSRTA